MKKGGRIRTLEYLLKTCEVGRVLEQRTHSPQEPWAGGGKSDACCLSRGALGGLNCLFYAKAVNIYTKKLSI